MTVTGAVCVRQTLMKTRPGKLLAFVCISVAVSSINTHQM